MRVNTDQAWDPDASLSSKLVPWHPKEKPAHAHGLLCPTGEVGLVLGQSPGLPPPGGHCEAAEAGGEEARWALFGMAP